MAASPCQHTRDYPTTLFHRPAANCYNGKMIAFGSMSMRGNECRNGLVTIGSGAPV
jgi:hypothetical protein